VADREILVSRLFDAPRELVFSAFVDPARISQWWGPHGFRTTTHAMDFRPGGTWKFVMHGPDGRDYKNKIVYEEIVRPEKLTYRHAGEEDTENVHFCSTILFQEEGSKTRVTMQMVFDTPAERDEVAEKYGAIEGANQTLERLGSLVTAPGTDDAEFVITRSFDAPRDLVFAAWTEAERLAHWWGPKGMRIRVAKLELKPGGIFHYAMEMPDGNEMWGKFVYREITPPERIVFVNSFSDPQGNTTRAPFSATWPLEVLNVLTFLEHDGKTTITLRGGPINATAEERATFRTGHKSMQQGFSGTFEQLAEYLVKAV
jgi:uncharacterized protein YndB with AHSA1/START domain